MTRPKLEVNAVWILQEVTPYDGSSIEGVFFDLDVAKGGRKGWREVTNGDWTTANPHDSFATFYLVTKHSIRTK